MGAIVTDQKLIENESLQYFNALFKGHHNVDLQETGSPFTPNNVYLPKVLEHLVRRDPEDSEKLEHDVTLDDLDTVIKKCDFNKAPGLDGLPYEFYKHVWPTIRHTFLEVIQCQLNRCKIVESNTVRAIRLCPKVEGVPTVDQLRPITLLNCHYDILSKLLVLRIKSVLPKIIRSSQLCTVGGKNILFGIRNILSSIFFVNQKKSKACLLSLDFYKAYDRVFLPFLLEVMEKMGFGPKFCSWIKMLHSGAKTKLILEKLSRSIDVIFSIRQGDPLAMLLYILYIEPLLINIEQKISGLKIKNILQSTESFCDDINVLTDNAQDLVLVDKEVEKFEYVSGAILSRSNKCKILGFGSWRQKTTWPLNYVQTVEELKIFGIFIMNSFQSMIRRNWDFRFNKFQGSLISWSSRSLDSIFQRVEIINMFGLSRVFYVASVLPMPQNFIKRVEMAVGKVIWAMSGKVLRVSYSDIKLPEGRGGLGLRCLTSMGKSLLLSQLLRLLKSGDAKTVNHIFYWMGPVVEYLIPDRALSDYSNSFPTYYETLAQILMDAKIAETVSHLNWKSITNKIIYKSLEDNFPPCRIELDIDYSLAETWQKLLFPCLASSTREILFLTIHNKLPTQERLFRIGLLTDPYCQFCLPINGAVVCDREHLFCECLRVLDTWQSLRNIVMKRIPTSISVTNLDLITLNLPKIKADGEVAWLIGIFLEETWKFFKGNEGNRLSERKLFGFLKFKFRADQLGARMPLDIDELRAID